MKTHKKRWIGYLLIGVSATSIVSIITDSWENPTSAILISHTYYVSSNGSDSNNGLSTTTPFASIQKAADLTAPGDTVFVMPGTYTNAAPDDTVFHTTNSGTSSAWIKYQALPGAKIQFNGWSGINAAGAQYIELNGFEVIGNNANITLAFAQSQQYNPNALTSGNCIIINDLTNSNGSITYPHHVKVLNNKVHDCGGGGIVAIHADYLTISNNTVYNTSWYSPYGNSGISLYQNWNSDTNTGYKMYVTNNLAYGNHQYIPSLYLGGVVTDGNGIILDDSMNTQNDSNLGAYNGRTYIANNIVFNNGGSGIHTFSSEHADIVNNTAYMNSQSVETKGEIFANSSNDVNIYNNIMYSLPGEPINPNDSTTNFNYDYNIYFNGSLISPPHAHDKIIDPRFVNPSIDPKVANFHLQPISPAINAGTSTLAPSTDFANKPRPSGSGYEIGAYEY